MNRIVFLETTLAHGVVLARKLHEPRVTRDVSRIKRIVLYAKDNKNNRPHLSPI